MFDYVVVPAVFYYTVITFLFSHSVVLFSSPGSVCVRGLEKSESNKTSFN